ATCSRRAASRCPIRAAPFWRRRQRRKVADIRRSDPRVPFVAAVLPKAAASAPETGETVDGLDLHHILGHLVAELTFDPKPERRAVLDLERRIVHLVGEDRLRVKRVDKVDRLVITAGVVERLLERVGAEEGNMAPRRLEPRGGGGGGELRPRPRADAAPPLN